MSEDTLIRMLQEAAGKVPDNPAPVGRIVFEGRQRVRRRRAAILGGAVAAVLVVAGGVGVRHLPGGGSSVTSSSSSSTTVGHGQHHVSSLGTQDQTQRLAALPAAPAGTRWVGVGSVMVAVPSTWPMRPGQVCEDSQASYVTVLARGTAGAVHCALIPPAARGSDRLTLVPAGGNTGQELGGAVTGTSGLACERGLHRLCTATKRVDGVAISFDSADDLAAQVWQEISDSIRPIPEGYVAVPWAGGGTSIQPDLAELTRAVRAAGLRVAVGAGAGGHAVSTDPEPGTVVPRGGLVRIVEDRTPPAEGTIEGRLIWSGGPQGTLPSAHRGTIHIVGTGYGGARVDEFVSTDRQGRWSYDVYGGGTFTITGTSAGFGLTGGTQDACVAAGGPVHVGLRPVTVTVTCSLR